MKTEFIHGKTLPEIEQLCRDWGQPRYRADQIWKRLYRQCADRWSQFTTLPASLRGKLSGSFEIQPVHLEKIEGDEGGTRKLLLSLFDNNLIETVLIPGWNQPRGESERRVPRRTVCVSTQAGCRYNCAFCASGKSGFIRDLTCGEIVGQVIAAWGEYREVPTHVVFMGVGEPLDNYEDVLRAIRIINDGKGLNIGARRITVSTCGVVPGIRRLASEQLQVELSVSLHAPTDPLRSSLMPVNRKYGIKELMDACEEYTHKTGRIVTFEYTLIGGTNDSTSHARRLVTLLSRFSCRVNLIPLSRVEEYEGKPSGGANARQFAAILNDSGINCTVRRSLGSDLNAACGQLRIRH